jgi:low affinity Fe/Cu permease
MSEQLANMAAQLKRNAMYFAGALEKDKAVVTGAQEKVERNFDMMTKERVRLRDHRSKSWGTTWLVVLTLAVALVGFIMTFFVIRIT